MFFNNNTSNLVFLAFYFIALTLGADSLGLTADSITIPQEPEPIIEGEGGLSAIVNAVFSFFSYIFSTISVFFQFLTFQVEIPTVLNFFVITPFVFGVFYMIIVMIRGGAD